MTMSRTETVLRAHEIGVGLTDFERIALGATLAQTCLRPEHHHAVRRAAVALAEHADALEASDHDFRLGRGATTHETASPMLADRQSARAPEAQAVAPPRRRAGLRSTFLNAATRLDDHWIGDHWLGDLIGALCLFALLGLGLLSPLLLQ